MTSDECQMVRADCWSGEHAMLLDVIGYRVSDAATWARVLMLPGVYRYSFVSSIRECTRRDEKHLREFHLIGFEHMGRLWVGRLASHCAWDDEEWTVNIIRPIRGEVHGRRTSFRVLGV